MPQLSANLLSESDCWLWLFGDRLPPCAISVQSKAFSRRLSLKHPQPPGHCSYLQFVTDCKDINAITWQSSIYFLKRSSCLCDWAISELKFDSYCCNLSKLCCLSKHRCGREVGFLGCFFFFRWLCKSSIWYLTENALTLYACVLWYILSSNNQEARLLKYFLQHEIFVPNLGEHLSRSKVIQE